MTPDHFTASTIAWIAAVVAILNAPVTAVLWAKLSDARARLTRHGETFKDVENDVKQIYRALPPPPLPSPPAVAPQAPVTPSAGFQGIAATPGPEAVNQSVVVDRATMTAAHAAIGEALAGGDTNTPPPPIERYVDRPTDPAVLTPLSQE